MRKNLLFKIAYKGTNYHGYLVQENANTITAEVQNAIADILGKREDIKGCSRTDAGVHANEYCFSMKTDTNIPPKRLQTGINSRLPDDIVVNEITLMPDAFHARYSSTGKEYIYKIYTGKLRDPFLSEYTLWYPHDIDIDLLNEAASHFVGTHDFTSLANSGNKITDPVRTINSCHFTKQGDNVLFTVAGNGFLYKMIRTMVGTLLFVNSGRFKPSDMKTILEDKNRGSAGKTVPPQGLYLNKIFY